MKQGIEFGVTLVRHARSLGNEAGYYCGQLDVDLVQAGVEQAELTGKVLKDETFDLVISSGLKRALKTALVILQQNNNISNDDANDYQSIIKTDELMKERSFGVMEGKNHSDFIKKALELGIQDVDHKYPSRNFTPEGGESEADVDARVSLFIKKLFANEMLDVGPEERSIKQVLLTSHSGWIRSFVRILYKTGKVSGITEDQMGSKLSNCAISKFAFTIDPETRQLIAGKCLCLFDGSHIEDLKKKM